MIELRARDDVVYGGLKPQGRPEALRGFISRVRAAGNWHDGTAACEALRFEWTTDH